MTKKEETSVKASREVPIKWNIPENTITRFTTNMLVQNMDDEFKISFFEVKPVITFSTEDPLPNEVPADCVASIIVTAKRLSGFVEVLQRQIEIYNEKKA